MIAANDTENKIAEILGQHFDMDPNEFSSITPLEGLNVDSLDRVEIAIALEDEFHIENLADGSGDWGTVGDIFAAVTAQRQ